MKRKPLKIVWEHDLFPTPFVDKGGKPVPTREPDFISKNKVSYWFNEMCASGPNIRSSAPKPEAWIMDICPRTGALMVLNPTKMSWFIQGKDLQEAYSTWVFERHFTDDSR